MVYTTKGVAMGNFLASPNRCGYHHIQTHDSVTVVENCIYDFVTDDRFWRLLRHPEVVLQSCQGRCVCCGLRAAGRREERSLPALAPSLFHGLAHCPIRQLVKPNIPGMKKRPMKQVRGFSFRAFPKSHNRVQKSSSTGSCGVLLVHSLRDFGN